MTDEDGTASDSRQSQPSGPVLFGGWVLYEVLLRAAKKRGHDEAALCSTLMVTKPYLSMIGAGTRNASTLSDEFFRACASYLDLPFLLVKIIAARISEQDLVELGNFVGNDISAILESAKACTLAPR